MSRFCPENFKQHFPLFEQAENKQLTYMDNAATTQKPKCVINASTDFYSLFNANVHRASHRLSSLATQKFEQARASVQKFINADSEKEIVWTKGTTESINLIAQTLGRQLLSPKGEVVVSHAEHHANIVPWQEVTKSTGAKLSILPLDSAGLIDVNALDSVITTNTTIVSIALISNVVGKINPIEKIITRARQVGAIVIVDAAQAIAHQQIDVQSLDCDFLVFSGHKMFGPTGIGVLFGKQSLLEQMPPYQFGGEMIKKVSFSGTSYGDLPFKFEPGTPNIAGVLGLAAAVKFLTSSIDNGLLSYEQQLRDYCYQQLMEIPQLQMLFTQQPDIPVFSFTLIGHHNQDVASYLNANDIAIRAGHHCAMPLMEYVSQQGCLRVSLSPYNSTQEVDKLVACLQAYLSDDVVEHNESIDQTLSIKALFSKAKGWDGKHREIMLLGKKLARMPKAHRSTLTIIDGCESDAWLKAELLPNGNWLFQADSDAKVIRGLLVVILAAFQEKTSKEIIEYDIESYFESLGLIQHLSPSRGNGVRAIVDRIKQLTAH